MDSSEVGAVYLQVVKFDIIVTERKFPRVIPTNLPAGRQGAEGSLSLQT